MVDMDEDIVRTVLSLLILSVIKEMGLNQTVCANSYHL